MAAAPAQQCKPGDICSGQFGTVVDGQNLFFSTSTTLSPDGGGVSTLNYWNGTEWIASATSTNAGVWTPTPNSPLSPTATQSLTSGDLGKNATANVSNSLSKAGVPKSTQDNVVPGSANKAQTPQEQGQSPLPTEAVNDFNQQLESIKTNQRTSYEDAIYPVTLKSEYQDCIKFSIVKYQQSGLTGFDSANQTLRVVSVEQGKPKIGTRTILATIVLPIPGGVQDGNQITWSGGELNDIQKAFGDLAQTGIMGGDAIKKAQKYTEEAAKPGSGARTAIVSKLTEAAIGQGGLMQRQFGTIINPNLELLFNSPTLRTFSFSFKLSPRSSKEAQEVKKIIRNFKQAMSVKRSESSFLLQSPHTFAISYIFKNNQHPYLNRFKECALTNCSVNYTPEGNYMAFDDSNEPSMVSYQLDLQFQELEPLYDDDYGDDYTNIGY